MATQFLDVPGGRIAYDDQSSGPLVVCVPGMGDVRGEYRFLASQLVAASYRVVTVDLRGHGESSVGWPDYGKPAIGGDIVALIRQLDAGPARIIGTSYAAGAAVCAAAQAPELVAGLVLVGAFVRDHGSVLQQRLNRALYAILFADPWGATMWRNYVPRLYPTHRPEDFAAYLAALSANLRQSGRMHAFRRMMATSSTATEAALTSVRAPALVLMGTRDPDFKSPEHEAAWIASQVHGTVQLIDGAGHYPHAELPDATGRAILAFLAGTREQQVRYGSQSRAE
jgi:pimeloyl-ACP methyl ester carboxylesterase